MTEPAETPFTAEDLAGRLVREFGYTSAGAQAVAVRLAESPQEIRRALWHWWQTGEIDDRLEIHGYTAARLVKEHGLKPPAAFATLDWLRREPEQALQTLRRGHDRIMFHGRH